MIDALRGPKCETPLTCIPASRCERQNLAELAGVKLNEYGEYFPEPEQNHVEIWWPDEDVAQAVRCLEAMRPKWEIEITTPSAKTWEVFVPASSLGSRLAPRSSPYCGNLVCAGEAGRYGLGRVLSLVLRATHGWRDALLGDDAMNLFDAIKSGRPYREAGTSQSWIQPNDTPIFDKGQVLSSWESPRAKGRDHAGAGNIGMVALAARLGLVK